MMKQTKPGTEVAVVIIENDGYYNETVSETTTQVSPPLDEEQNLKNGAGSNYITIKGDWRGRSGSIVVVTWDGKSREHQSNEYPLYEEVVPVEDGGTTSCSTGQ